MTPRALVAVFLLCLPGLVHAQAGPEAPTEAPPRRPEGEPPAGQPEPDAAVAAVPATPAGQAGPRSVALVVSGGVSLGAYEAGYVHFASEAGKATPGAASLKLVAGASAGSVNSLVAATNHCLPMTDDPRDSVGWQAWIPIGYRSLFDEDAVSGINIFTRKPLRESGERLWKVWRQGLRDDCDVVLAVSTTRFDPIPIRLAADLAVPRQEEKFVLRIEGRGPGVAPRVTNYGDPAVPVPDRKTDV